MKCKQYCLMIMQVLVPVTVLAVYHAFAYCAKNFSRNKLWKRYGVKAHSFLAAHQVPSVSVAWDV